MTFSSLLTDPVHSDCKSGKKTFSVTVDETLILFQITYIANGSCRKADWWLSFDRRGWSKCPARFPYINGLYRSNTSQPRRDTINLLEEAKCCRNGNQAKAKCVKANW
ncbi:Hypothetical predicted protein, partial [Paramuricea clavata]